MSPAQEFACHMRFQLPWMSRAIRDWFEQLDFGSDLSYEHARAAESSDDWKRRLEAELFNEIAADLEYASLYVIWYGVQES